MSNKIKFTDIAYDIEKIYWGLMNESNRIIAPNLLPGVIDIAEVSNSMMQLANRLNEIVISLCKMDKYIDQTPSPLSINIGDE